MIWMNVFSTLSAFCTLIKTNINLDHAHQFLHVLDGEIDEEEGDEWSSVSNAEQINNLLVSAYTH